MPSVVSSYIYTLIALTSVGALLIYSLNSYTATIRNTSETDQLKNILNGVAAKANELVTLVLASNSSVKVYLQLPPFIGSRQYWMQLQNDSSSAWLEGSLGQTTVGGEIQRVSLPAQMSASGYFISGRGLAVLDCYLVVSAPRLNLGFLGG